MGSLWWVSLYIPFSPRPTALVAAASFFLLARMFSYPEMTLVMIVEVHWWNQDLRLLQGGDIRIAKKEKDFLYIHRDFSSLLNAWRGTSGAIETSVKRRGGCWASGIQIAFLRALSLGPAPATVAAWNEVYLGLVIGDHPKTHFRNTFMTWAEILT